MKEDFSMFSKRKDMDSKDYYLSDDGYIVFTESIISKEVIVVKVRVNTVHMTLKKPRKFLKRLNIDSFFGISSRKLT